MAAPFSYESYNNSSSASAPVAVSSSSRASRTVAFVLRILTLICLLISMVILTTNTATLQVFTNFSAATGPNIVGITIHFKDIYTYRYLLGATVFGMAYMLLQIVVTLCSLAKGGNGSLLFDFYGDKVVSYILATGSAAAFGATRDMKPLFAGVGNVDKFFNKGYASASLLLLGFVCTAILSVMSSYALPKRH
ncbi:CASP-like protein 4D1 [Linum grandiflorum]